MCWKLLTKDLVGLTVCLQLISHYIIPTKEWLCLQFFCDANAQVHRQSAATPNYAWLSLDLLEILCGLAELGHLSSVRSLLEIPLQQCSELLIFGLAQVKVLYFLSFQLLRLSDIKDVFLLWSWDAEVTDQGKDMFYFNQAEKTSFENFRDRILLNVFYSFKFQFLNKLIFYLKNPLILLSFLKSANCSVLKYQSCLPPTATCDV